MDCRTKQKVLKDKKHIWLRIIQRNVQYPLASCKCKLKLLLDIIVHQSKWPNSIKQTISHADEECGKAHIYLLLVGVNNGPAAKEISVDMLYKSEKGFATRSNNTTLGNITKEFYRFLQKYVLIHVQW